MTQPNVISYKSWTPTVQDDVAMGDAHYVSWQALIDNITEQDLTGMRVLDYGCNQGHFLRHLYKQMPFASGLGVDPASDTIEKAQSLVTNEPITYKVSANAAEAKEMAGETFDIAFSHEVVYLIPDLNEHARQIKEALKEGGSYYIALGAQADNPLWPRWKELVAEFSPVAPQSYTADDICSAFMEEGFDVFAQRVSAKGFLKYGKKSSYYESFYEKLSFYFEDFILFKMVKA